jgi:quercetin dioxygenase-like cupin family protein
MGCRIVFGDTAALSDGEILRLEFFLAPGRVIAEEHFHPVQRERFEVVSGRVAGRVQGVAAVTGAGESSEIEPGVRHCWWNAGREEAHLVVEFRPALRTEDFFEEVFALAREGRTDEHGVPRFLDKAVLARKYRDEFRPARVPPAGTWVMAHGIAPIAALRRRRSGRRPARRLVGRRS